MSEQFRLKPEQDIFIRNLSNSLRFRNSPTSSRSRNVQSVENWIWSRDYASDIILSLKESEKRRRTLDYKSRQTSFRPSLLHLMKTATDSLSLRRTTLHLAVYLLDCFMDTYTIAVGTLNASALMCLLLAAKIEETDKNVPKFSKFNELVGNIYAPDEFMAVEIKILTVAKYDLICPTAATFVESYSNQLVSFEDYLRYNIHQPGDRQKIVYPSYEAMIRETTSCLFNVSDISLHDNILANYPPSIVGAACLATTRVVRNIEPIWTDRLVALTGYDLITITPCKMIVESLYAMYAQMDVICESPDSGIASDSNSESDSDDDDSGYQPALKRRKVFN